MDFSLDDEQRQLVRSLRQLLADASPLTNVRRQADSDGPGHDLQVWKRGCELGWSGLTVPSALDGLDRDLVDAALVAEEHGRAAQPGPLISSTVATAALLGTGNEPLRARLLPRVACGDTIVTWAFAEPGGAWDASGVRTVARIDPDAPGYRLDGVKVAVQDAGSADGMVVTARLDGGLAQFLVPTSGPGVSVRRQVSIDVTRRLDEVTFSGLRIGPESVLHGPDTAQGAIDEQLRTAAVLVSADSIGVGRRLLEMTVDYVKMRVQFDRPIGSFQAVKHRCASMRIWLQSSAAATYYAAMAVAAASPDADEAVSVAKALGTESISRIAGEALQLHGGIGFTWEHDLHLYLRRAKANEVLFGTPYEHYERLCTLLE